MYKFIKGTILTILFVLSYERVSHSYQFKTINQTGSKLTVKYTVQELKGPKTYNNKNVPLPNGTSYTHTSHAGACLQSVSFQMTNGPQAYRSFSWGPLNLCGGFLFKVSYDPKKNKLHVTWKPTS